MPPAHPSGSELQRKLQWSPNMMTYNCHCYSIQISYFQCFNMLYSKANSRAFARKRRNLHFYAHVPAENKRRCRWKQMHMTAVFSYRTCVYFYAYEVAMQTNTRPLGGYDHEQNTDRKRRFLNFRKGTEILKERIWSGLFSASSQNGNQYYDVGPLCPIALHIWDGCQYAVTSRCSRIYGGLVIPSLNIAPSGMTSISFHSNSGRVWPMSRPYAPVSSEVSHNSTTPSKDHHNFLWQRYILVQSNTGTMQT